MLFILHLTCYLSFIWPLFLSSIWSMSFFDHLTLFIHHPACVIYPSPDFLLEDVLSSHDWGLLSGTVIIVTHGNFQKWHLSHVPLIFSRLKSSTSCRWLPPQECEYCCLASTWKLTVSCEDHHVWTCVMWLLYSSHYGPGEYTGVYSTNCLVESML